MSFEQALGNALFSNSQNKANIDKLTSKEEADKIENLIKKDRLTQSDLRLLQAFLSSNELKVVNSSEWSRYILGKYIAWIHQLIEIQHFHMDNIDKMKEKGFVSPLADENNMKGYKSLDEKIKTLVGSYLYWLRSGLSLKMVGFDKLSSTKVEFNTTNTQAQPKETNSLFGGGN